MRFGPLSQSVTSRRSIGILALWLSLACLSGCASVPSVNAVVDDSGGTAPHINGPRGPLTVKQSKAILAKLQREAGDTDVLQRHLALEGAVNDSPIYVGNKITVLPNGEDSLAAIFDAVQNAQHDVNLEYFTFENVQSNGRDFGDLLLDMRRNDLQINVIYDSFGSAATADTYLDELKSAGVNMVDFNPMNPLEAHHHYAPNNRDHRKIMVVDGQIAIIGGVNLSKVYMSGPFRRKRETKALEWKDTDVKIEGPAVAELQRLFLSTWQSQQGPPLDESTLFPKLEARGDEVVHILGSSPTQTVPSYYASLLSAIRNAENRVWIATAYFVPTDQEIHDLIDAARRGADVKLMLPGKTDSPMSLNAGRANYSKLLANGIEIFETDNAVLHSKTAVIDSVWSTIGSSNFDHRSVIYNNEVDVVVLGRDTAGQLEAIFKGDAAQANQIDLATWKKRPIQQRVKEFFAHLWVNML